MVLCSVVSIVFCCVCLIVGVVGLVLFSKVMLSRLLVWEFWLMSLVFNWLLVGRMDEFIIECSFLVELVLMNFWVNEIVVVIVLLVCFMIFDIVVILLLLWVFGVWKMIIDLLISVLCIIWLFIWILKLFVVLSFL